MPLAEYGHGFDGGAVLEGDRFVPFNGWLRKQSAWNARIEEALAILFRFEAWNCPVCLKDQDEIPPEDVLEVVFADYTSRRYHLGCA